MKLTDAWLEQQREEFEQLCRAYGIKRKKYHYLEYNNLGELVCYQETPDSPVVWVRGKKKKMNTSAATTPATTSGRRGRKPKLSDDAMAALVADVLENGMNQKDAAAKYGVSQGTVSKIIKRFKKNA